MAAQRPAELLLGSDRCVRHTGERGELRYDERKLVSPVPRSERLVQLAEGASVVVAIADPRVLPD